MKHFEVKALGLEEMNQSEIASTNGGSLATLIVIGVLAAIAGILALTGHKGRTQANGNGVQFEI